MKNRSSEQEIMDDLAYEGEVLIQTLKELEIINSWLGGNAVTLDALEKVMRRKKLKQRNLVSIADLGCGGGDILKLISAWAVKNEINASLTGVDANNFIIEYANKNCSDFKNVSFITENVLSEDFKARKFDIINCTLFCHHFDDLELINLLKGFKAQASTAIIINDIHRHWFAYYSIKWLTTLFSRSYMVKSDSKLSVLRAFLKEELEEIIQEAGFSEYTIEWKWAFRYQVILYV